MTTGYRFNLDFQKCLCYNKIKTGCQTVINKLSIPARAGSDTTAAWGFDFEANMEYKRDFKGIWIPKHIWLDSSLNALEKVILAEIDSLSCGKGCFASNKYIAEFCQCSESKVSKAISKLIDVGYLQLVSFDGRERILQSCLVKNARQTSKKCEADKQNMLYNNINNNKENNIEYSNEFAKLWAQYPRKEGKAQAEKSYIAARKSGTTFEDVEAGVKAYANQVKSMGTEQRYIKHGSTWFNQKGWLDEYKTAIAEKAERNFDLDEAVRKATASGLKYLKNQEDNT